MRSNQLRLALGAACVLLPIASRAARKHSPPVRPPSVRPAACRTEVLEGEADAGQRYAKPMGNGLQLLLQPIHSGWILRVVPNTLRYTELGRPDFHDFAELATPPYQSVTPLSLSTDFAFRAQDAVGWNPRRFRFASSIAAYARLEQAYQAFQHAGAKTSQANEAELAEQVAQAAEGLLTIEDARLIPGSADQWSAAAAVSSRFSETAHTLVLPAAGEATPLGRILWVRFRVELELPPGFAVPREALIVPHLCGSR